MSGETGTVCFNLLYLCLLDLRDTAKYQNISSSISQQDNMSWGITQDEKVKRASMSNLCMNCWYTYAHLYAQMYDMQIFVSTLITKL